MRKGGRLTARGRTARSVARCSSTIAQSSVMEAPPTAGMGIGGMGSITVCNQRVMYLSKGWVGVEQSRISPML